VLQRYKRYFSRDSTYLNCFIYNYRLKIILDRLAAAKVESQRQSLSCIVCARSAVIALSFLESVISVKRAIEFMLLFFRILHIVFITHRISDIFDSGRIDSVLESGPFIQRKS